MIENNSKDVKTSKDISVIHSTASLSLSNKNYQDELFLLKKQLDDIEL